MIKINFNQVIKEFKECGFEVLDTQYKNIDSPLKCKDKDGYLYSRTLRTIRNMNKSQKVNYIKIFDLKNKYYWDNILHYMNISVHNGTRLLSDKNDYKSCYDKLSFQCGRCGKIFKKDFKSFMNLDNKICPSCYKEIRPTESYIQNRRTNIDIYKQAASKVGLTILSNDIPNNKSKVEVMDNDGFKGVVTAIRLLKGSSFEKFAIHRNPYIIYNLQKIINDKGFHSKIISLNNYDVNVECECGKHFIVTTDHLVYGNKCVCNDCSNAKSILEQTIEKWLINNNIEYIPQYVYNDLKGVKGKLLKFDFYLPAYNTCIEVNGRQHYKPVSFGEKDELKIKQNFEIIQEHDKRKSRYCKKHNINLLVIPFWTIEKDNSYIDILQNSFH